MHPLQFHLEQPEKADRNQLRLRADTTAVIDIFVLEQDIIRVRVLPDGVAHGPRTWAIAPGQDDVVIDGRNRLDLSGFSLPAFALQQVDGALHVQTDEVLLYIASTHAPLDAVKCFTWMTGTPAWMPRSGLGYSCPTMSYTDAPDARQRMNEFIDKCREHDILCDSFHLSSGYTSIGDKRYVFNWNHEKFPDIHGFIKSYTDHGVALCANIKPCLLRDHPAFDQVQRERLLIATDDGQPAWVQFWNEVGAYLDFTNPATVDWWKGQIKTALLDYVITSTWNDNNEFEIWNTKAMAHGFGKVFPAHQAKVLQTMLMMRASRDAQREHAPQRRPFLVSRSGGVGMHRYVQTWSGDNYTSWETLRYNIKMALGLALSGISNSGTTSVALRVPRPEWLVRWVQHGMFLPRFSIHSWNRRPQGQRAVDASAGHGADCGADQVALSPYSVSLSSAVAMALRLRAGAAPDLRRVYLRSTLF